MISGRYWNSVRYAGHQCDLAAPFITSLEPLAEKPPPKLLGGNACAAFVALDWAMTQNNLGNTLRKLGERQVQTDKAKGQAALRMAREIMLRH